MSVFSGDSASAVQDGGIRAASSGDVPHCSPADTSQAPAQDTQPDLGTEAEAVADAAQAEAVDLSLLDMVFLDWIPPSDMCPEDVDMMDERDVSNDASQDGVTQGALADSDRESSPPAGEVGERCAPHCSTADASQAPAEDTQADLSTEPEVVTAAEAQADTQTRDDDLRAETEPVTAAEAQAEAQTRDAPPLERTARDMCLEDVDMIDQLNVMIEASQDGATLSTLADSDSESSPPAGEVGERCASHCSTADASQAPAEDTQADLSTETEVVTEAEAQADAQTRDDDLRAETEPVTAAEAQAEAQTRDDDRAETGPVTGAEALAEAQTRDAPPLDRTARDMCLEDVDMIDQLNVLIEASQDGATLSTLADSDSESLPPAGEVGERCASHCSTADASQAPAEDTQADLSTETEVVTEAEAHADAVDGRLLDRTALEVDMCLDEDSAVEEHDVLNDSFQEDATQSPLADSNNPSPPPTVQPGERCRVVHAPRRSTKSSKLYDTVNACVFCGKLVKQKIKRHLVLKHCREPRVQALVNIDKARKKVIIYKLMCEGNDRYNQKLLRDNAPGEIIVLRRPRRDTPADEFEPCHACRGYVLRSNLLSHIQSCPCVSVQDRIHSKRLLASLSSSCTEAIDNDFSELQRTVLSRMHSGYVKDVILQDSLLMQLGSDLLRNRDRSVNRISAIGSKLRSLAKLLMSVRSRTERRCLTLEEMLQPMFFDAVMMSVRDICGWEPGDEKHPPRYKTPNLALQLGYGLERAAAKAMISAKWMENEALQYRLIGYFTLHKQEWGDISQSAGSTLSVRKMGRADPLPLTENTEVVDAPLLERTALDMCPDQGGLVTEASQDVATLSTLADSDSESLPPAGEVGEQGTVECAPHCSTADASQAPAEDTHLSTETEVVTDAEAQADAVDGRLLDRTALDMCLDEVGAVDELDDLNDSFQEDATQSPLADSNNPSPPPTVQPGERCRVVHAPRRSTKSSKLYDTVNACLFCGKLVKQKIKRHLVLKHCREPRVQALVNIDKAQKKVEVYRLMCEGNDRYNQKLLRDNAPGEIIVLRRPRRDTPAAQFAPCHACRGYVIRSHLWSHIQSCPCASDVDRKHSKELLACLSSSSAELNDNDENVYDLQRTILSKMHSGDVKNVIMKDSLLMQLGSDLLRSKRKSVNRVSAIGSKLQSLAKLLMSVRSRMERRCLTLEEMLQPRFFDAVMMSVRDICGWEPGDEKHPPRYKTPNLALQLGHGLEKAAAKAMISAKWMENEVLQYRLIGYFTLHKQEWGDDISQSADSTLSVRKMGRADPLPLTENTEVVDVPLLERTALDMCPYQGGLVIEASQDGATLSTLADSDSESLPPAGEVGERCASHCSTADASQAPAEDTQADLSTETEVVTAAEAHADAVHGRLLDRTALEMCLDEVGAVDERDVLNDSFQEDATQSPLAGSNNPSPPPTVEPGERCRVVHAPRRSTKSKLYDTVNACVFCGKLVKQKIKRHLVLKHCDEPRVQALVNIDEAQKKVEVYKLMCEGNDRYNQKLLRDNVPGEIMVLRRPRRDTPAAEFAPCHACRGYVIRSHLWSHIQSCPCASDVDRKHSKELLACLSSSSAELNDNDENVYDLQRTILSKMHSGDVKNVIMKDSLLMQLGSDLLRSKRKSVNRVSAIGSKLQSLAKLLMSVRSRMERRCLTLEEMLQPRFFDAVMMSVRDICGWEPGDEKHPPRYKTPNLALQLGHGLERAAAKAMISAKWMENEVLQYRLIGYFTLHKQEWGDDISQSADSTLSVRKMGRADPLPLTENTEVVDVPLLERTALDMCPYQGGLVIEASQDGATLSTLADSDSESLPPAGEVGERCASHCSTADASQAPAEDTQADLSTETEVVTAAEAHADAVDGRLLDRTALEMRLDEVGAVDERDVLNDSFQEDATQSPLAGSNNPSPPPTVEPGERCRVVHAPRRSTKSKLYDTVNACVFCGKLVKQKIKRHLVLKHCREPRVQALVNIDEAQKKVEVYKLMCEGNDRYNQKLLRDNVPGEIMVLRRPRRDTPAAEFAPCHACRGYVIRSHLWSHIQSCPCASDVDRKHSKELLACLSSSSAELNDKDENVYDLQRTILSKMHSGDVKNVIMKDSLLMQLGSDLLRSKRKSVNRVCAIRSKLRSLAKLLMSVRSRVEQRCLTLKEMLQPKFFDAVMMSVRDICGWEPGDEKHPPRYKTRSLALQLRRGLKGAAVKAMTTAKRTDNETLQHRLNGYLLLHKQGWGDGISQSADSALSDRKMGRADPLPLLTENTEVVNVPLLERRALDMCPDQVGLVTEASQDSVTQGTLADSDSESLPPAGEVGEQETTSVGCASHCSTTNASQAPAEDTQTDLSTETEVVAGAETQTKSVDVPLLDRTALDMCPEDIDVMDERDALNDTSQDDANRNILTDSNSENSPLTVECGETLRLVHPPKPYDKVNACVFCGKLVKQKIKRHLVHKHCNEPRVQAFVNIDEAQKKVEVYKLMCEGNDRYNQKLLKDHVPGEIIVLKRPLRDTPAAEFAPCHACRGYVIREDLQSHMRNCPCASDADRRHSNGLLACLSSSSTETNDNDFSELQQTVLSRLHSGDVKDVILKDSLLMQLGSDLLRNKDISINRLSTIRSRLRCLAKLLMNVRSRTERRCLTLEEMLQPRFFDAVMMSVRDICGWEPGDEKHPPRYKTPNLALQLGYGLERAAAKAMTSAKRTENETLQHRLIGYFTLHKQEWGDDISQSAGSTLSVRRMNRADPLPLTENVMELCNGTKQAIQKLVTNLNSGQLGPQARKRKYNELIQLSCSAVTVFNKRRRGEAAQLLVDTYKNRTPTIANENVSFLSPLERELAKTMCCVQVDSKREGPLPILLAPYMVEALDVCIQFRSSVSVPASNPYLFAKTGAKGFAEPGGAIRLACKQAKLEQPELIKGQKLRKYLATVSQVLNLEGHQVEWVANHLSQDTSAHHPFPGLPEDVRQVAKVSHLLLASEQGQIHLYRNKPLDEIDVSGESLSSYGSLWVVRYARNYFLKKILIIISI